jgi:RecB family exonuclease
MIKRVERGKNHSYSIDGVHAMGVTTAISRGMPKPALPYWSARTVAEHVADLDDEKIAYLRGFGRDRMVQLLKGVPWAQRDAAAARGTEVHKFAEKLIHGEEVHVPDELAGHVEAAAAFMDAWKVKPLLVEKVVASRALMYAGTFDMVAELPSGRRILFDYKTGKSGIWPETALQLAAYRWADCYLTGGDDEPAVDPQEIPMTEVGIDAAMAVWVRADGYDVVPVDTSPDVFRAFVDVLRVARASEQMSAWVHEAVAAP